MNRYLEGDYRRLPQQNLAGASRTYRLDQLIVNSQSGRKKREKERILLEKAINIQACYRGYRCRKFWREFFKTEFERKLKMIHHKNGSGSLDDLAYLLKRLPLVYPKRKDLFGIWNRRQMASTLKDEAIKFMEVVHLVFEHKEQLIEAMTVEDTWMWRVIRFLNLTMKLVKFLPNGCERFMAKILQTILFFTKIEKYSQFRNTYDPLQVLMKVWSHLFENDVFLCLVKALNLKLKYREIFDEVVVLTKLCLQSAITVINSAPDIYFKRKALRKLAEKIIKPPLSQEASRHILPYLRNMEDFPLCEMGRVVVNENLYHKYPETLFIMLYLDNDQKVISYEDQPDYFSFVSLLLSHLYKLNSLNSSEESTYVGNWDYKLDAGQFKILQESMPLLSSSARAETWKTYLNRLLDTRDHGNLLTFCSCLFYIWVHDRKPLYSFRVLQDVAFHQEFLNQLLVVLKATVRINYFGNQAQHLPLLTLLARGVILTSEEQDTLIPPLIMFCYFLKHSLSILNDDIFYKEDGHEGPEIVPFKLNEIREITKMLKEVTVGVISLAFPTSPHILDKLIGRHSSHLNVYFQRFMWRTLLDQLVSLLRLIHNRDSRRQFTDADFWLIDSSLFDIPRYSLHLRNIDNIIPFHRGCPPALLNYEDRYLATLRCLPFVIDFMKRIMLYQHLINELKSEYQNPALHFLHSAYVLAQIRRDYIYEDSFEKLDLNEVPELRIHVKIHLISSLGVEEPGIDGGGLFREFIIELLKTAFDPNRGFFLMNKDNELYPNPKIEWIEKNFKNHYFFIGRMLGKAMYENVLVEIPLAEFFLAQLLADQYDQYLNGLASLDPDMYRNLMSLMNYRGDFSDMGLDFTVSIDCFGTNQVIDLKPGGSTIPVTKENLLEYIHLVARYKTISQIEHQTDAFLAGLISVIPKHWISMFSTKELQLIISGNESPIDIADLRENAVYTGGYTNIHPTVQMFWRVLGHFNAFQKSQLLKFVTSCSRPPLLGFKELYPPFCIQFVEDENLLPSASTCMNILKLPNFQDEQIMQEKILYAISSGSGFELI